MSWRAIDLIHPFSKHTSIPLAQQVGNRILEPVEDTKPVEKMKDQNGSTFIKVSSDLENARNNINSTGLPEFDGLSPNQMSGLLYTLFSDDSIIQFHPKVNDQDLDQVGFFQLIEFILQELLEHKEIKLTKWNNMNTTLTTVIYHKHFTSEEVFSYKERKVYKQSEIMTLQNAMTVLNKITRITKIRNNSMSLTKKGLALTKTENRFLLFQTIFTAYYKNLNWGYHDGYPESQHLQFTFGFTLYLLLKYGNEQRNIDFYSDKLMKAFPMLKVDFENSRRSPERTLKAALSLRCFQRFLEWFNIIEVRKEGGIIDIDTVFIKNLYLNKLFVLKS